MTVTIAVSFPLGRYHATPWENHVNEGVVEWPPSPWRLCRALFAVWKERCPDLPTEDVEQALNVVGSPPTYHLPRWRSASTRHYYPAADHRPPAVLSTDKIIDSFVAIDPDDEVVVEWAGDLEPGPAEALRVLVEALPFLGRADSVCSARVVSSVPASHEVLPPTAGGAHLVGAPRLPLDMAELTVSTDQMRSSRLKRPRSMVHHRYVTPTEDSKPPARVVRATADRAASTTMLFSVHGRPAPTQLLSVALADVFMDAAQKKYSGLTGLPASPVLSGHLPDSNARRFDQHQHIHVFALANRPDRPVTHLVAWAPEGFGPDEVAALASINQLRRSVPVGSDSADGGHYRDLVRGFAPTRVILANTGQPDDVVPQLVGPSVHWTSLTPFQPNRHQKKSSVESFLSDCVQRELAYRGISAQVMSIEIRSDRASVPSQRFRRHRIGRSISTARPAFWLSFELDRPVSGPLALGGLSHFGLGLFGPAES